MSTKKRDAAKLDSASDSSDDKDDSSGEKDTGEEKPKEEEKPKSKKRKPAPIVKAPPAKKSKSKSEAREYQLSGKRKASVTTFKNQVLINIREYYTNNVGEELPGKKGISLTQDQWEKLKQHVVDIDNDITELSK